MIGMVTNGRVFFPELDGKVILRDGRIVSEESINIVDDADFDASLLTDAQIESLKTLQASFDAAETKADERIEAEKKKIQAEKDRAQLLRDERQTRQDELDSRCSMMRAMFHLPDLYTRDEAKNFIRIYRGLGYSEREILQLSLKRRGKRFLFLASTEMQAYDY